MDYSVEVTSATETKNPKDSVWWTTLLCRSPPGGLLPATETDCPHDCPLFPKTGGPRPRLRRLPPRLRTLPSNSPCRSNVRNGEQPLHTPPSPPQDETPRPRPSSIEKPTACLEVLVHRKPARGTVGALALGRLRDAGHQPRLLIVTHALLEEVGLGRLRTISPAPTPIPRRGAPLSCKPIRRRRAPFMRTLFLPASPAAHPKVTYLPSPAAR